ncbi:HYR domain-containing protein [Polaribacter gochangensis]|uniref:HYR domain-containing protein n=1 Tax=Polaribacter gochangensis TaxID=3252903 RepID=UPI003904BE07
MKTKLLKKHIGLFLIFLFIGFSASAHTWEIRVKQNTDGTLTWYGQSYHRVSSCGINNSGIQINGVNYNWTAEFSGSQAGQTPYVLTVSPTYNNQPSQYSRQSYGTVTTPYIPGALNVVAYSTNACWALYPDMPVGNSSFTPPPPPVCTTPPINTWTNTIGIPNNNGTDCDPTDDTLPVTINVNHQSCGSITNAGTFSVYLAATNTLLGNFTYATGINTNATINLPYGFDANTLIKVVDDSFGASPVTHTLAGLSGTFNGVPSTSVPTALVNSFSVNLNASGSATITAADIDAGSSDACGPVTLAINKTSFSCTDVGSNTVTLTVTSPSGNQSTANAIVTVVDNIPPTITSPFDITVNADPALCGARVTYGIPTATDNCGTGDVPTSLAGHTFKGKRNGHSYFLSNTKTTPEIAHANAIAAGGHLATISDASENLFVSNFIADKIWIGHTDRDTEGQWKWITNEPVSYTNWAPGEPNNAGGNEDWAVINWSGNNPDWNDWYFNSTAYYAIEFDGGTIPTTLVSGPAPGDVFPVGTTTVTYEAVDASGNKVQTSFKVTVKDNVAPTVSTQNITVELDANGTASITAAQVNNGSSDNCAIESMSLDITSFTCANIGENTVTLTVTDASGNTASQTAVVTVTDGIAPTVITQPISVNLDASGNASITAAQINNGSSDNCAIESMSLDITSFTCANIGDNTVTLTVTDPSGNTATKTAIVTVSDAIAPTVITKDFTIPLANGMATITSDDINNGSFDNCDITLSIDKNTFTCSDIGDHTVTLTATDSSGNTSSETATVTIEGETPEVTIADFNAVETQQANTIFLGFGPQSMALTTSATGGDSFTYVWTASTGEIVSNVANPVISPTTSTTYTVTATNNFGCTTTTTIEVCVMDVRSYNKKGKATNKVTVCHHTSGKKGTKHVMINISANAVMKHLLLHGADTSHGDSLGDCNATCITPNSNPIPVANDSENLLNNLEFNVYPNPSKGVFQLKIANIKAGTQLNLMDVTGKLVSRKTITSEAMSQNITIGNRNLPSGIYILKIVSKEETITKKLIVSQE